MKGELEELFSYARFADDKDRYSIVYRDFDTLVEVSLPEWDAAATEDHIPDHRIVEVRRDGRTLFKRSSH